MSALARLTVDLARRLGTPRIVSLGCRAPNRLAEIAERMPVVALDWTDPLERLGELAPAAHLIEWAPAATDGKAEAALAELADNSLVVCDMLLDQLDNPRPVLEALNRLLEVAATALITVANRDLVRKGGLESPTTARWNAEELLEVVAAVGLETVWTGLTDATGPVGRRAGLTCAVSRNQPGDVRAALAPGPLGLGFDPAAELRAGQEPSRICIASYEFVGPTRTGGIGTAYTSLAEALADAGHEVTLLFTGWEDPAGEPFSHWVKDYRARGIRLERLPQPAPTWIETGHRHAVRSYEAYRWLRDRDRVRRFDVIHFPEVLGHGHYAIRAQQLGVAFNDTTLAVGTHSSTSWVLEANGAVYQAIDDFADDHIERRCVADCDVLISPSAYMLDWMRTRRWQLPDRSFVQQYARSRTVAAVESTPSPPPDGRTEIVFFGRLEPRKGLRVFCDALDLLAAERQSGEIAVVFLGKQASIDGVEAGEYLAARSRIWPWQVEVIDELSQPEAIKRLRSPGRRITVIPSLADNSPNTVYEALALGIPFIASRVGGTAELIDPRDLAHATFDPGHHRRNGERSGSSLAEHLRAALVDEHLRTPRPSVAADVSSQAHVRWNASVRRIPNARAPAPNETLSVCVVGSDRALIDRTRSSVTSQSLQPVEVVEAPEHAAAKPSGGTVLFVPAGSELTTGALEQLERSGALSEAEIIALTVASRGPNGAFVRVPVGGPPIAGLLRRCFGDSALWIQRGTLERLGGFDRGAEPADQAHTLLCRAAVAGIEIEVMPDPLVVNVPDTALMSLDLIERSHRRDPLLDVFRDAPPDVVAGLPLLTQQLFSAALEREREFVRLYENRFGRLTAPIRRAIRWARRLRRLVRVIPADTDPEIASPAVADPNNSEMYCD